MRCIFLLCALFLIATGESSAQEFYFRAGYGLSYANPREINRLIDVHNNLNRFYYNTGSDFNKIHFLKGVAFGIGQEYDVVGYEILWENKHTVSKANFMYNNEEIERQLKIRSNFLCFAFYGGGALKGGLSIDVGTFKGFYKRAPKGSIKDTSWTYLFQTKHFMTGESFLKNKELIFTTQVAFTPFIQYERGPLGVRLSYQFHAMKMDIDDAENRLLGGSKIQDGNFLEDKMSNVGLLVYLKLGGRHD